MRPARALAPPAETIPATLVEILRLRATETPDRRAYTFLANGEDEAGALTWGELDAQARAIAVTLRERIAPGERALLLHPPGIEFLPALFGCFYAGVVGVPAFPPRKGRHDARVEAIAQDSGARVALTSRAGLEQRSAAVAHTPALAQLDWIATDDVPPALADRWETPSIGADSLAYLQYTSGSTSVPKGVMVSHGNLVYNLADLDAPWEHDEASVFVTWLPVFHDMGLIYGLLQAVHRGFQVVQMSPEAFIQRPVRWLRAISKYRGTHSAAPNFAYDLCVRKTTPAQRAELDLSSWRNTLNAAEPVIPDTMRAFTEAFAPCGFRATTFSPGYGLAEATLKVSAEACRHAPHLRHFSATALERHGVVEVRADDPDARELVGCGPTMLETRVEIVDPETRRRLPPDRVGEIWVAGPSRALGYWNRPDDSRDTFEARLAGEDGRDESEPHLRTGDLGFVHGGQVFITGRRKDLIIVRGSNHYPQDIEWTAQQSHPALRPGGGAAFAVPSPDGERVVVVHEVRDEKVPAESLRAAAEALCAAVAREHEVVIDAVQLVGPGGVPKTSSGKKQRRACRDAFLEGTQQTVHEWRSARMGGGASVPPAAPASTVDALLSWVRGYAETRINSRVIDERRTIPPYIVMDFASKGLLAMQAPPSLGGLGLGTRDFLRVVEQLGAIDQTLALFVSLENVLGARPLLRFGSAEAKERIVGGMVRGTALAAFALTEPGAGSNPRALEGRAIPDGEGRWKIHATKWWSGAASWSGFMHVFVHEVGRDGRARGISAFTVPQETPGVRQGPEALTMGMRGIIQNAIHFEGARVEERHRLGAPGRGMEVAEDAMSFGRLAIAAMSLGGMKRCAQLMLRYAGRRRISTGRLIDNPVTEARLSEVVCGAAALEAIVARVAEACDAGVEVPPELHAVCKVAGPELFWSAADGLVQLLGGRGYVETNLAPQILRDARVLRIFEGPTETLRMYLGARLWSGHDGLQGFLAKDLHEPELAARLRSFTEELRSATARAAPESAMNVVRLAQAALGEVAAAATLLAAASDAVRRGQVQVPVVAWARERLEQALTQARHDVEGRSPRLAATDLSREIALFSGQIGDIDQHAAGEEHELDPILRRDAITPRTSVETPPPAAPDSETAMSPAALAVRAWLVQWIARELRVQESEIDGRRPFTEYGIDSVTAVQLVGDLEEWLETRLELGLAWAAPSIDQLAVRVTSETADEAAQDLRGDTVLPDDIRIDGAAPARDGAPRRVLLTGATGFLGAHLLHDLLHETDAELLCLVRADGAVAGGERLRAALASYGLWRPELASRITPVPGDLSQPRLGLSDETYRRVCDEVDAVYHCGALVNFAYPYAALRQSNVLGAIEILRVASTGRLKPLHYVSTFSLAGQLCLDPRRETAREAALFDKPVHDEASLSRRFFDMGYVQSKWVADQLMLAAQDRGLPVAVYRPASICGSRVTGAWTRADWVVRLLEGCARMGAAPTQDADVSLVPVDWVSRTIVALSKKPESLGRGFNLGTSHRTPWSTLVDRLEALGFSIEKMEPAAWLRRLAHEARAQEHPLYPLVPMLSRRPADRIVLGFPPSSRASVLLTEATLEGTGLECPPVDDALVDRYLRVIFGRGDATAPVPVPPAPAATASAHKPSRADRRRRYGALFERIVGEGELSRVSLSERGRELARNGGLLATDPRALAIEEALQIAAELVTTHANAETVDRARWTELLEALAQTFERTGRGPPWLARLLLALFRAIDLEGRGAAAPEAQAAFVRRSRAEIADAFTALDTDGDGRLGLEEFEDAFLRLLLAESDEDAGVRLFLGRVG